VPVPLMAPPTNSTSSQADRLRAVAMDCLPAVCIVGEDSRSTRLPGAKTLCFSDLVSKHELMAWADVRAGKLAFLQYTSGSTSLPKGVMVSHKNLVSNSAQMSKGLGTNAETAFGSWLPLFHDMGLIGKVIHPLFLGAPSHFIRPETFLRRPRRWLELISSNDVVISAAPDFAYARCIEHVSNVDGLDLSRWTLALNGSEPVRSETIEKFARKFGFAGFRRESFQPVYGLAEATLFVTSRGHDEPIRLCPPDLKKTTSDEIESAANVATAGGRRDHVSVGRSWLDCEVVVCKVGRRLLADEGEVGEIYISGENCVEGFFNKAELSRATFGLSVEGKADLNFFNTGDLGFLFEGQLYVTGRTKELIVLRGRNIYPQDIESVVQGSCDGFVKDGGAAVEVEIDGQTRVALVQEVKPNIDDASLSSMASAAIKAVSEVMQVTLYDVILIRKGSLPKTTSGKIARNQARELVLKGGLGGEQRIKRPLAGTGQTGDELIAWWRLAAPKLDLRLMDERRFISPKVILDFGNRGFLGLRVSEQFGGSGLSVVGMMRIIREVASVDLNLASFLGVHNGLAIGPLLNFANHQQKERYLRDLARGRILGCFALTELAAGSNMRAIQACARRREGGWVLQGKKIWIGTSAWASLAIFFAHAYGEAEEYLGLTAFLVRTDLDGVVQGNETLTMGMRGMVQNELALTDVRVDDDDVLGAVGQGYEVAQSTVAFGRLGVAAMALGCMQRASQWFLRYSDQRTVASGTLLRQPVIAQRLFKIQVATIALEALTGRCAMILDHGDTVPLEVLAAVKAIASEQCWIAVDQLLQCYGGRGYDEATRIPQMLRDCRLLRIFEGSTEALYSHVGHSVWQSSDVFRAFVSAHFKVSTGLFEEFELQVKELHRKALGDKESGKALYVGLGEAFGYFLLEVALGHKLSDQPNVELSEFGIRMIRDARDRVLSDLLSSLDTPSLAGNIQILRNLQGSIDATIGDHVVPHVKGDSHADNIDVSNDLTKGSSGQPVVLERRLSGVDSCASFEAISSWMADWLNARSFSNNEPAAATSFAELGLDSIDAVELLSDFSDYFGHEIDPTVLWQYPTQEKLSVFLSERLAKEIGARGKLSRNAEYSDRLLKRSFIDRLERELNES